MNSLYCTYVCHGASMKSAPPIFLFFLQKVMYFEEINMCFFNQIMQKDNFIIKKVANYSDCFFKHAQICKNCDNYYKRNHFRILLQPLQQLLCALAMHIFLRPLIKISIRDKPKQDVSRFIKERTHLKCDFAGQLRSSTYFKELMLAAYLLKLCEPGQR